MSALPPKADIRQRVEHICFVPIADTPDPTPRLFRPVLTEINFGNFVLVFFLRVGPQKQFNSRQYARIV